MKVPITPIIAAAQSTLLPAIALLAAMITSPVVADDYVVLVRGLGGNTEFDAAFTNSIDTISASLNETTTLSVFEAEDATRDIINEHMLMLSNTVDVDDQFTLMLVGHGNAGRQRYRFNVPGSDISETDLIQWLDAIPAAKQLIVVATSASGGLQELLASSQRIVVTATKSPQEQNAVQFHQYWAQALNDSAADADHNDIISADEAFEFATRAVADYYDEKNLLATEHAVFNAGHEITARRFVLNRTGTLAALHDDSQVNALLQRRDDIEDELYALMNKRAANPSLTDDAYYAQLEVVLLKLARMQLTIDAAAGETP